MLQTGRSTCFFSPRTCSPGSSPPVQDQGKLFQCHGTLGFSAEKLSHRLSACDAAFPQHLAGMLRALKRLQAHIHLFIRRDLHCTPLAMLEYKLCISDIKSSFRSEQSHICQAIKSMVLQTSLSSSTFLLHLLASESLCPDLTFSPPHFTVPVSASAVFSRKSLTPPVTIDQKQVTAPCSKTWEQKDGSS